jgi:hypothetical protein
MLASGSWYDSPLTGVVIGIAGIALGFLGGWLFWKIGPPRRQLAYWAAADTPLVTRRAAGLPQIEVRLVGHQNLLQDPHVLSVRLQNLSRQDITPGDFSNDLPLVIDTRAPILNVLNRDALTEQWPHLELSTEGSKLAIRPTLIPAGARIAVDLLTEGTAGLTDDSQLGNVRVYRASGDPRADSSLDLWRANLVPFVPVCGSLIAFAIGLRLHALGPVLIASIILAVLLFMVALATARRAGRRHRAGQ